MANPLTPQELLDALREWDIDFELYPGWETRESGGESNPIGFMIHHTGGAFTESNNYLDFLFNRGRPGIPGPLCNFSVGPSGTVYVGSLENANHAGMGDWTTRVLVGSESYDGYRDEIDPGPDDYGTGNELFWGVEINYPGTLSMRSAQYKSTVRLSAALMDAFSRKSGINWSALSVVGHREHSRRKWDPGQQGMDEFRRDVRDLLKTGPKGGWLEMATKEEVKDAFREVIQEKSARVSNGEKWSLPHILSWLQRRAARTKFASPYLRTEIRKGKGANNRWLWEWAWHYAHGARTEAAKNGAQIATLAAQVAGLSSAVEQLSSGGINLELVQAAAQSGAEAALQNVQVTVDFPGEQSAEEDAAAAVAEESSESE